MPTPTIHVISIFMVLRLCLFYLYDSLSIRLACVREIVWTLTGILEHKSSCEDFARKINMAPVIKMPAVFFTWLDWFEWWNTVIRKQLCSLFLFSRDGCHCFDRILNMIYLLLDGFLYFSRTQCDLKLRCRRICYYIIFWQECLAPAAGNTQKCHRRSCGGYFGTYHLHLPGSGWWKPSGV